MSQTNENSNAMFIHLSAFASYFIPFGSILLPLILWQTTKKDSKYIDHHGKEAVNFNLSYLLYTLVTIVILVATVLGTVFQAIDLDNTENPAELMGLLFSTGGFVAVLVILSIIEIVKIILIIVAAVRANQGDYYKYPLTIRFIK